MAHFPDNPKLDLRDGGRRGDAGVRGSEEAFTRLEMWRSEASIMWRESFPFNPAQIYYNLEIQQKFFEAGITI